MTCIAIILVDLERSRFGHRSTLLQTLAGKTVLQHTIDRAARIEGIDAIALVHPGDQSLDGQYAEPTDGPVIRCIATQIRAQDRWLKGVIDSGRAWSLTAWRGGIGGMTIYDELLPAYPLLEAARQCEAESVVALRGDWCCVDPALARKQLELHRSAPEAMKLTFTQAPPGLSPLVVHRSLLEEMAERSATVANLICYNPAKPVIDPVGKDVNVPIPASVRDQFRRFVYDTPRAIEHLTRVAEHLDAARPGGFDLADSMGITDASRAVECDQPWLQTQRLPQQFDVELTPRRAVNGSIVPQHYLELPRGDLSTDTACKLIDELSEVGDASVIFGGLGDALLHEEWQRILAHARGSGLLGVGIETDLLVDEDAIDRLAELPLDAVSVRMNADSAAVYESLMGVDGFGRVMSNLQRLFERRQQNRERGEGFTGWIVPRLVKVSANLSDMETFFERWMQVAGWAVIDRAATGRGLIPDMSPVPMEVPRPEGVEPNPYRLKRRLTVLSSGALCLCHEDWLGRCAIGVFDGSQPEQLASLWRGVLDAVDAVEAVERDERLAAICPACRDWLAAQRTLQAHAAEAC